MIIVCQKCKTRFHLDDEATDKPSFVARCTVCGHLFSAYKPKRVQEIAFIDLERARRDEANDHVITIGNRKGGVAKTTTCFNLGVSLALNNKKVLLVDFDAQANLTLSLGLKQQPTFYDAQKAFGRPLDDFITATPYPNLWLLPSGRNMVMLNKLYFGAQHFEYMLKDRLNGIKDQFDFILIDTPPAIEFYTLNALTASNRVVIPCQCDYLSTHGVDQVLRLIALIRKRSNPQIRSRILFTMLDRNSHSSRLIFSKIKDLYAGETFDTVVEMDGALKEAQILSMPAIHYNQQSVAGAQYLGLAKEIIANPHDPIPSSS
ncbi:sporulation initiation inhibitor Soj [Desulfosarcina alkanivorans]|uniref:Sporulation initiation inhibitor Soj n=1 Tax=Desulfosarcina alkanivorans TaxID=571177 RepID=A0A5K7YZ74_9BACT|nr:AAA family ATPase [Desulfosarcina alkanivorans]BBO72491.1 sporulation initiation inhibitor Soj [Desulfosarcina alkanivorans]